MDDGLAERAVDKRRAGSDFKARKSFANGLGCGRFCFMEIEWMAVDALLT
jgi:hypothetical protein